MSKFVIRTAVHIQDQGDTVKTVFETGLCYAKVGLRISEVRKIINATKRFCINELGKRKKGINRLKPNGNYMYRPLNIGNKQLLVSCAYYCKQGFIS
jgi:hypothetical protein